MTSLSSAEGGDNLLDEEPEIMQRRAAGQKSLQVSPCAPSGRMLQAMHTPAAFALC